MSAYDPPYDAPSRSRYDDRYDDPRYDDRRSHYGDPREARDSYVKPPTISRELVPHHRSEYRDDRELAMDRAYPASYSSRDVGRARSTDPGRYYDDYYDGDRHSTMSRGSRKKSHAQSYYDSEAKRRRRVLSSQEKIIAAVAGAALALGGKEVFDRRAAHSSDDPEIHRNYLHSAALGAAGAAVGYQGASFYNKRTSKADHKKQHLVVHRGRDGRDREDYYYSDDEDDAPAKKASKSFLESALGVTSLGAALKALTGGGDKDSHRDDTKSRGRSRSRSSGGSIKSRAASMNKLQKSAMAGLLAGATEAFRLAKEPGSFKGEKAKRVVTAALGASAIGGAQGDKDDKEGTKMDIAQSVIGGLLGNRIVHGSKRNIEEDSETGRSRSRSRLRSRSESGGGSGGGGGGLAALASAGLAALGTKKAIGSRSDRDDSRGRSPSPDRHHRSRSRSVVDSARKSLARLGIGSDPSDDRRDGASDYGGSRASTRRRRRYSDESDDDDDYRRSSRRDHADDDGRHRTYHDDPDDRSYRPRRKERGRSDHGSESDLGYSSDDERRARKLKGKQVITTGLAAIASIHAAHGVYKSMGNRKTRQLAVEAGRMTPQEARALKSKAALQDAAAVGLACLGVKGAVSELKEAKNLTHEVKAFRAEKRMRHDMRMERRATFGDGHPGRTRGGWSSSSSPQPTRERSRSRVGRSHAESLPSSLR